MTDAELIARLRYAANGEHDMTPHGADILQAVDRIEELISERDQHWDSFVHWRKEADDRSEQLAAARRDAEEAEAYAEELQQERNEAIRRRDAWKAKAEGYDAVRKALREKVGAPWPPNLSRALWAGIAADEKKRADDAETKLAKAVEALGRAKASIENGGGGGVVDVVWLDGPCPETLCDFIDATLAEIKGESHDPL